MGGVAPLPRLQGGEAGGSSGGGQMSARQHARSNREAAARAAARAPRQAAKRPPLAKAPSHRKPTADELALNKLKALHSGRGRLSDEMVVTHLSAELRRLQGLTGEISRVRDQADERAALLEEELDTAKHAPEVAELSRQNRSLRLDLATVAERVLEEEQAHAERTLAALSPEGQRQLMALSSGAAAHALTVLWQQTQPDPADDVAIASLHRELPNASEKQVARHLRAEVRRLAQELADELVLEEQAQERVDRAEDRLAQRTKELQTLGDDPALGQRIATLSSQNVSFRLQLAQHKGQVYAAARRATPESASEAEQADAAAFLAGCPAFLCKLLTERSRWPEPFLTLLRERQERGDMIHAATKIAAVMRGKAARVRARNVRAKLMALDAFMDSLIEPESESDDEKEEASAADSAPGVLESRLAGERNAANKGAGGERTGEEDGERAARPTGAVAPRSWAEQMLDDISGQIDDEEQAVVRIQAVHRGKLARKRRRLRAKMQSLHRLNQATAGVAAAVVVSS